MRRKRKKRRRRRRKRRRKKDLEEPDIPVSDGQSPDGVRFLARRRKKERKGK